ncbi:hypothetical protein [Actinoplanes solisilvae]|uniref:hypothetical protein n=1 Tax=Actinoplanes solisilvae TaxID=2486853 RepID=UPI000FD8DAC3|nr:hypothetical protein [Actinoplanes solisilvae]
MRHSLVEGTLRVLGTGFLGVWHMRPKALRRRAANRDRCHGCRHRHHRLMRVLAILLGFQVLGVVALAAFAVRAPLCRPPSWMSPLDAQRYVTPGGGPIVALRQFLTAGQTGLALAYAETRGADVCRFAPNGNLTARMETGFARGGTMFGHIFLTHPQAHTDSYEELLGLKRHEARHTEQWALFTVLGGPAAFPVAYSVDELFAPGAFNHFERHAGLREGNYAPPDGPSPTATRLLLVGAIVLILLFERHRVRRQAALLLLLARRFRQRAANPWWHEKTEPVPENRLVRRVSPTAAGVLAEHRRLRQLGCSACGDLPKTSPQPAKASQH